MTWIITLAEALISIKSIAGYVEQAIQALVGWYIQKQTGDTLAAIADAAALAARAKSDDDRYKAAQAWQDALSRARVSK